MKRSTIYLAILALLTVLFPLTSEAQRTLGGRRIQLDDNTGRWIQLQNFDRGIGIGTATPHSSAIFQVEGLNPAGVFPPLSTPRGVLFAPMATANRDAIVSPIDGLLIYNIETHQYEYWNGMFSSWTPVGGGWNLTGNNILAGGTNVGQNFIGTLNAQDFVIGTDVNVPGIGERVRVIGVAGPTQGFVGVNTPTPTYQLDVNGSLHSSGNTDLATDAGTVNSFGNSPNTTNNIGNGSGTTINQIGFAAQDNFFGNWAQGNTFGNAATANSFGLNAGSNDIGSVTAPVVVNNTIAQAVGGATITTTIGNNLGTNTINMTTSNADMTLTVPGAGNGDLVLNGIDNSALAGDILWITNPANNEVRRASLAGLTHQGITLDNEGAAGSDGGGFKWRLGSLTDGGNAIATTRFVRMDAGGNLTFNRGAGAANNLLTLTNSNTVVVGNPTSTNTQTGATNTITATTGNNTITATAAQNVITGQTGNVVNATTGNNSMNANGVAGQNLLNANTNGGDNILTSNGNGTNTNALVTTGVNSLTSTLAGTDANIIQATGAGGRNIMNAGTAAGANFITANGANGINSIEATGAGGQNRIFGTTNINASQNFTTNINTGTTAGVHVNVGQTGGGIHDIILNTDNAAVNGVGTSNLVLNGIDVVNPLNGNILFLNTNNFVKQVQPGDLVEQGITFALEAGVQRIRLGGLTNGDNPIFTNRFVQITPGTGALMFTRGALPAGNLLTLNEGGANAIQLGNATSDNDYDGLTNTITGTNAGAVANSLIANGAGGDNLIQATTVGGLNTLTAERNLMSASFGGAAANVIEATGGAGQNVMNANSPNGQNIISSTGNSSSANRILTAGENLMQSSNGIGTANTIRATAANGGNFLDANAANGTNTLSATGAGGSNNVIGTTNINASQNFTTNINTGTTAGVHVNVGQTGAGIHDIILNTDNAPVNGVGTSNLVLNGIDVVNPLNGNILFLNTNNFVKQVQPGDLVEQGITFANEAGIQRIRLGGLTNGDNPIFTNRFVQITPGTGSLTFTNGALPAGNLLSLNEGNVNAIQLGNLTSDNDYDGATNTMTGTAIGTGANNIFATGLGGDNIMQASTVGGMNNLTAEMNVLNGQLAGGTANLIEATGVGGQNVMNANTVGGNNTLSAETNTVIASAATTNANVFMATGVGGGNNLNANNTGGKNNMNVGIGGENNLNALALGATNNINAQNATGSNNITGTTNINDNLNFNTNINTTGGTGNVNVGHTAGSTHDVVINTDAAAVNGAGTSNLILNGIDIVDPINGNILFLQNPGVDNLVKQVEPAALVEQGLTFQLESGQTRIRLGGINNTQNPFEVDRFVNLDIYDLSFTRNAGANTTMFLEETGEVGINNNAPTYTLDVTGTLHNTGNADIATDPGTTNTFGAGPGATNDIGNGGGSTNRMGGNATLNGVGNRTVAGATTNTIGTSIAGTITNNIGGSGGGGTTTTNIGSAAGTNTINMTTSAADMTLNVPGALSGNDLIMNGIDPVTLPADLLMINQGTNEVRRLDIGDLTEQGITFDNEGGEYRIRLGGLANTDALFEANRFVNIDQYELAFTGQTGPGSNLLVMDGATAAANVITIENPNAMTAVKINANGGVGLDIDPASTAIRLDATTTGIDFYGSQPTTGINMPDMGTNGIVLNDATATATAGIRIGNVAAPSQGVVVSADDDAFVVLNATAGDGISIENTGGHGVNIVGTVVGNGVEIASGAIGLNVTGPAQSIRTDAASTLGDGTGLDHFTVNAGTGNINLNASTPGAINITGGGANIGITTNGLGTFSVSNTTGLNITAGAALSNVGATFTGGVGFMDDVVPTATNTYDLGDPTLVWNNVYANNITMPTFTPGSVLFAGVGGLISEDNANFFWNDGTNALDLGGALTVDGIIDGNAAANTLGDGTAAQQLTVLGTVNATGAEAAGNAAWDFQVSGDAMITGIAKFGTASIVVDGNSATRSISSNGALSLLTTAANLRLEPAGVVESFANIIPTSSATYNLGDNTHLWSNLWVGQINMPIGTYPNGAVLFMNGGAITSQNADLHFDFTNARLGVNAGTAPTSTLEVNGSVAVGTSAGGNVTLDETHTFYLVTGPGVTVTLPAANTCRGRMYIIKNNAAGTTTNVNAAGGNIDGVGVAPQDQVVGAWSVRQYISNGTDWYITSTN